MTKIEALEFLELPESAMEEEIKVRLEEKLDYFEQLSEKSPSEFLRRLHAKNVIKVRQIAEDSREWAPFPQPLPLENALPPMMDEEPSSISRFFTKFVSGLLKGRKKEKEPRPAGWLVRHTENQRSVMLPLYPGKNFLGRKANSRCKPFLAVEGDRHVSKIHAVIFVEGPNEDQFNICDDAVSNEGRASTNGTYINGNEERVIERTLLRENDTIQIGVTKYILRTNKQHVEKIMSEVEDSEYIHTVVVDIP